MLPISCMNFYKPNNLCELQSPHLLNRDNELTLLCAACLAELWPFSQRILDSALQTRNSLVVSSSTCIYESALKTGGSQTQRMTVLSTFYWGHSSEEQQTQAVATEKNQVFLVPARGSEPGPWRQNWPWPCPSSAPGGRAGGGSGAVCHEDQEDPQRPREQSTLHGLV